MSNQEYQYLGKKRKLLEGLEKVTGKTKYATDVSVPGMLYIRPVLSPHAHAKITSVDFAEAEAVPGVVAVLTAQDLITKDKVISSRNSAILAKDEVLFCGQPVVAVVAESEVAAQDGAELVFIDYEPLQTVVDMEKAVSADSPSTWPNGRPSADSDITAAHGSSDGGKEISGEKLSNVHDEIHHSRGDVEKGFAEADVVLERTYRVSIVHQAYMEPHAVLADPDPFRGSLTIHTGTQGQYLVRNAVANTLSMPRSKVRLIAETLGGGFGAKYGIVEPLAGAIAMTLKRPVKMVLTRSEDFLTTTPGPGCKLTVKIGARNDGKMTALQVTDFNDSGVFTSHWGRNIALLIGGYYKIDNVKLDCYEVCTHKPQTGAYRAPGSPQATFALESHIDELAGVLGMDPIELRMKNAVEEGDLRGDNQPWPHLGMKAVLQRLSEHPAWQNRNNLAENEGVGIAIGGWPCRMLPAASVCKIDNDGVVRLQIGSVDISGLNSSIVLIAAEILGVHPDEVELIQGDTSTGLHAPSSGASVATSSMANAIIPAAQEVRRKLIELAAEHFEASPDDIELKQSQAHVKGVPDRSLSIAQLANMANNRLDGPGPLVGDGTATSGQNAPAFVAHLARVKVDPETGKVTPLEFVAVQDVGFALNPLMVEGQIHGGVVQGIGLGLHEKMVYDESGQLLTASFMDYDIPNADNVPKIDTVLVNNPAPNRPFGARGVAEPPITAPSSAIANAIKNATGVRVESIPITPELLWQALQKKGG
ncbi:MAG: xanthine dehydrogenase family protein molybdopterin-binding subunit [SAR324 cluster bacterium]|nr:xanthine dehydrogenase family protein molybdopterin-binding subunit [SAR324 cluster bacterium]